MSKGQKVKLDLGSFYHGDNGNNNDDDDSSNRFSWRRDPEESFSDWTIVIIPPRCMDTSSATALLRPDEEANVGDEKNDEKPQELTMGRDGETDLGKNTTYHVHKFVVGVSPRGSQYFRRLFQSSKSTPLRQFLAESATSTSLIELQSSAAVAFPIMLDFMYFVHSTEVKASSATAVALRYLANYFDVPTLFESVNQFIQNNMDKDNLHIYLEEAILYQDEAMIEATMKVGANAWKELLVDTEECPVFLKLLPSAKQMIFTQLVAKEAYSIVTSNNQQKGSRLPRNQWS